MRRRIGITTTRWDVMKMSMEQEICGNCRARWGLGEACEDWCETSRPVAEPVPVSCLAVEEQEVNFFEEAWRK